MNETSQKFQVTPPEVGTKATETVTAGYSSEKVCVWLVDDNDQFRTLVADLLSRRVGIECARQFASPDALLSALASKRGPDVILLDIEMGAQNGLDAVRPIKSLTRSTRVVMFTTFYDPEYHQRALSHGASDYLLKSGSLEKLVECIRPPGPLVAMRPLPILHSPEPVTEPVRIKSSAAPSRRLSARPLQRTLQMLRSIWN